MTKEQLKRLAINQSLFRPTTLAEAFNRLGFVQADPIRSPARAEELILRQRVNNYRVGDLDKNYARLGVEEDFLYAHGFMTHEVWGLLHPRQSLVLEGLQLEVYEYAKSVGLIDSTVLAKHFGNVKTTNWWGGSSQATRMALEELHYHGYIRIAGRKKNVRIYEYFEPVDAGMSLAERKQELAMKVVSILGPVQQTTLNQALHRTRRLFGPTNDVLIDLIDDGRLIKDRVDELDYIMLPLLSSEQEGHQGVKFLAPFDPLVWDRKRFEHLWGWPYRFEAYTPAVKRIRGYYAMPLLYRDEMIGWVNVIRNGQDIVIDDGYVKTKPKSKDYQQQFDREVSQLRKFLGLE